jgi:hypothetical protein
MPPSAPVAHEEVLRSRRAGLWHVAELLLAREHRRVLVPHVPDAVRLEKADEIGQASNLACRAASRYVPRIPAARRRMRHGISVDHAVGHDSRGLAMPRHLHEITAAMDAYAWTTHGPVQGPEHAPSYCAIGALLRHVGVPHDSILPATVAALAGEYDSLLQAKYGISAADVLRIIWANSEAQSRADATWRVLGLVSGTRRFDNSLPQTGGPCHRPRLPPAA